MYYKTNRHASDNLNNPEVWVFFRLKDVEDPIQPVKGEKTCWLGILFSPRYGGTISTTFPKFWDEVKKKEFIKYATQYSINPIPTRDSSADKLLQAKAEDNKDPDPKRGE